MRTGIFFAMWRFVEDLFFEETFFRDFQNKTAWVWLKTHRWIINYQAVKSDEIPKGESRSNCSIDHHLPNQKLHLHYQFVLYFSIQIVMALLACANLSVISSQSLQNIRNILLIYYGNSMWDPLEALLHGSTCGSKMDPHKWVKQ